MTPEIEEILTARQTRAETVHDAILTARDEIRKHLEPDSPAWLRGAFNELHAAHHVMGGDPFNMDIRAALSAAEAKVDALSAKVKSLEDAGAERYEFAIECGRSEIARIIESHDAFDCPDHLTFVKAANLIADSIVEKFGRARSTLDSPK